MNHYLDITILPDPEFKETALMNIIFSKLHLALVNLARADVGISFPHVKDTLGTCLRLHGDRIALDSLMALNWLKGMRDYIVQTEVKPVPNMVKHRVVKRVQTKSSAERLRRRSISKGWLSEAEAVQKIPLTKAKRLKLPFLNIKSFSSNQTFRFFIEHGPVVDEAVIGSFSVYGLSGLATIPWF